MSIKLKFTARTALRDPISENSHLYKSMAVAAGGPGQLPPDLKDGGSLKNTPPLNPGGNPLLYAPVVRAVACCCRCCFFLLPRNQKTISQLQKKRKKPRRTKMAEEINNAYLGKTLFFARHVFSAYKRFFPGSDFPPLN